MIAWAALLGSEPVPAVWIGATPASIIVEGPSGRRELGRSPWAPIFPAGLDIWLPAAQVPAGTPVRIWSAEGNLIRAEVDWDPSGRRPAPDPAAILAPDRASPQRITAPLVLPVLGSRPPADTFLAPRSGGRRHLGQDLMAPRMTPVLAPFAGRIELRTGSAMPPHYFFRLSAPDGWLAWGMHLNNDRPGSDDGQAGPDLAFAPGLRSGDSVGPGQFLGWVGDSGNAEETAPHLHFELWHQPANAALNPHDSLQNARRLEAPAPWLPAPELPVEAGGLRWDGEIRSVSGGRADWALIAESRSGSSPKVFTAPESRSMDLSGVRLALWEPGSLRPLDAVRPGDRAAALGTEPGPGAAFRPRAIIVFRRASG